MLELHEVSVGYGQTVVVYHATLTVRDGEMTTLLGHNGAGKTTLLRAATGLLRPAAGRVVLDGEDITRMPPHARAARGIGYVPQGQLSFGEMTTAENLQVVAEAPGGHPDRREEMLELFPALREQLDRPSGLLSGGQRQQLAIARALLRSPRYLLMDEPTEGIQPTVVAEIEQVILRLVSELGVSVLLVEQQVGFGLRHAATYAVLESGRIARTGVGGTAAASEARAALAL